MAEFYTSADAVVERDGEYLMIKEGKPHVKNTWNIPGGGIEHGEDPVEAVKREVYEETGLKVEQVNGLKAVLTGNSSKDRHPVIVFLFSVDVEEGEPKPKMDEEVLEAKFVDEEEIEKMDLRNDITEIALERRDKELLPTEAFQRYGH